jgi:hypothetical protein
MRQASSGAQSLSALGMRKSVLFSAACILAATSMLLFGAIFYITSRAHVPASLEPFQVGHFRLINQGLILDSLPDFIHAAAFTFLTCAFLRPRTFIVLSSALFWAAVDVLWEYSCADQQAWLRFAGARFGISEHAPSCTYDGGDIAAAVVGSAAAAAAILLVLRDRLFASQTYRGDKG